jgi:hypothetical protein
MANALSCAVREAEELRHLCLALPARLKEAPQWRTNSQGGLALENLLGKHMFASERICQGALTSYGCVKVAVVVKGSVEFTHDYNEGALKVCVEYTCMTKAIFVRSHSANYRLRCADSKTSTFFFI